MPKVVLTTWILYTTLSVVIGSISYTAVKVIRLRKPKQITANIKK